MFLAGICTSWVAELVLLSFCILGFRDSGLGLGFRASGLGFRVRVSQLPVLVNKLQSEGWARGLGLNLMFSV